MKNQWLLFLILSASLTIGLCLISCSWQIFGGLFASWVIQRDMQNTPMHDPGKIPQVPLRKMQPFIQQQ